MYQEDYFAPTGSNDYDEEENIVTKTLRQDPGLCIVTRKYMNDYGELKNKRIRVYTSSGTKIRDAETGEYYPNKLGSNDEDLFFKVIIATGECKSKNGSSTLFYCSPQHYENHLLTHVEPERVASWESRRDSRLRQLKNANTRTFGAVLVK